jgi:hypothetical protein
MAGSVSVKTTGLTQVLGRINALAANLPEAVGRELFRDMDGVLLASRGLVPVDLGDLRDSGDVDDPKISGGEVSVTLHYGNGDVDYALVQHEDMSLNHPNGGEPKFLETPLNQWGDDGPADVAVRAVKRAAR